MRVSSQVFQGIASSTSAPATTSLCGAITVAAGQGPRYVAECLPTAARGQWLSWVLAARRFPAHEGCLGADGWRSDLRGAERAGPRVGRRDHRA